MRKNRADIEYYAPGRKRRVAGSTRAVNDFLVIVHAQNPTATIAQLKYILTDRTKWLLNPDALAVLNGYIRERGMPISYRIGGRYEH